MTTGEIWAEIEADQSWRETELRFLQNQLAQLEDEQEQNIFRRTLVVMLYSHFEGFCKFALLLYVRTINDLKLRCVDASFPVAAAAMSDVFANLRDPFKKCPEFADALPDDSKLHRFARDREFLKRAAEFGSRQVDIPDTVVDVEDNLKPIVLRKALYRLGLEHDRFASVENEIHLLLSYRNGIAHGSLRSGITAEKYEPIRLAAFQVMNSVKREIMAAVVGQQYLRTS